MLFRSVNLHAKDVFPSHRKMITAALNDTNAVSKQSPLIIRSHQIDYSFSIATLLLFSFSLFIPSFPSAVAAPKRPVPHRDVHVNETIVTTAIIGSAAMNRDEELEGKSSTDDSGSSFSPTSSASSVPMWTTDYSPDQPAGSTTVQTTTSITVSTSSESSVTMSPSLETGSGSLEGQTSTIAPATHSSIIESMIGETTSKAPIDSVSAITEMIAGSVREDESQTSPGERESGSTTTAGAREEPGNEMNGMASTSKETLVPGTPDTASTTAGPESQSDKIESKHVRRKQAENNYANACALILTNDDSNNG